MSGLKRFFHIVPLMIAWLMLSVLFWGFVFSGLTDAPPEKKLTLYVDGTVLQETDLALVLEKTAGEGIRLVQVHPFSYALFGSDALRAADLYIVPEEDLVTYVEWFAPLPEELSGLWPKARLLQNSRGQSVGVTVYDEAEGIALANGYIGYEAGKRYGLCLGACSLHVPGNAGNIDDEALGAAQTILSLE